MLKKLQCLYHEMLFDILLRKNLMVTRCLIQINITINHEGDKVEMLGIKII